MTTPITAVIIGVICLLCGLYMLISKQIEGPFFGLSAVVSGIAIVLLGLFVCPFQ